MLEKQLKVGEKIKFRSRRIQLVITNHLNSMISKIYPNWLMELKTKR
jgi:hypothetical protein